MKESYSSKFIQYEKQALQYGENPHQKSFYYKNSKQKFLFDNIIQKEKKLTYNNLLDADSAYNCITEFNVADQHNFYKEFYFISLPQVNLSGQSVKSLKSVFFCFVEIFCYENSTLSKTMYDADDEKQDEFIEEVPPSEINTNKSSEELPFFVYLTSLSPCCLLT